MGWFEGIVVYTIIWWCVLFTVLPWGIRRNTDEEKGHDAGAPARPRLLLKFAVTTVISTVLFGVAWYSIASDLISFRT